MTRACADKTRHSMDVEADSGRNGMASPSLAALPSLDVRSASGRN
jgi:hypothetical protein